MTFSLYVKIELVIAAAETQLIQYVLLVVTVMTGII